MSNHLAFFVLALSLCFALASSQVITGLQYNQIGGSGNYAEVIQQLPGSWPPPCNVPNSGCNKQVVNVSGPLAPFDQQMTVVFRGPIQIYNIGVYYPDSNSNWNQVASYNTTTSKNLVFMGNYGGGANGDWSVCQGASQTFATSDGKNQSKTPQQFNGYVDTTSELNIMSSTPCTTAACGWSRPVAMQGFGGDAQGRKMFLISFSMPNSGGNNQPAIWALNANIVRTAQYGCNCWSATWQSGPGNCGELDIAEILQAGGTQCTSTIYYFKNTTGTGNLYFQRPVNGPVLYAVIFELGFIRIQQLSTSAFSFSSSTVKAATVQKWLAMNYTVRVPY